jgi:integration host factor subunit beta
VPTRGELRREELSVLAYQSSSLEKRLMTKSALIALLARHQQQLPYQEVARAINLLITQLSAALAGGERIEIRGFGSFTRHCRRPRLGRNPKTGTPVPLAGRYVPYFKPGKALRQRVNPRREPGQAT